MRTPHQIKLLLASCALLFAACAEDTNSTTNTSNFTGSNTSISALSDAQIEAVCMQSTEVFYQAQVSFECASPAFQAALTNMPPPEGCEGDVTSCINGAAALDTSAPCEPTAEDEADSPSCIYQECVASLTAQREAGCMATEAQVVACGNDSAAQISFTPAQLCSGEAIAALFGEGESSDPSSCTELEMICPDPEE
jgi:hypothetical protein